MATNSLRVNQDTSIRQIGVEVIHSFILLNGSILPSLLFGHKYKSLQPKSVSNFQLKIKSVNRPSTKPTKYLIAFTVVENDFMETVTEELSAS